MAEKVVEQAATYSGLKRRRWRTLLRQGAFALLWGGGGAAVTWLILQVL